MDHLNLDPSTSFYRSLSSFRWVLVLGGSKLIIFYIGPSIVQVFKSNFKYYAVVKLCINGHFLSLVQFLQRCEAYLIILVHKTNSICWVQWALFLAYTLFHSRMVTFTKLKQFFCCKFCSEILSVEWVPKCTPTQWECHMWTTQNWTIPSAKAQDSFFPTVTIACQTPVLGNDQVVWLFCLEQLVFICWHPLCTSFPIMKMWEALPSRR